MNNNYRLKWAFCWLAINRKGVRQNIFLANDPQTCRSAAAKLWAKGFTHDEAHVSWGNQLPHDIINY